MKIRVALVMFLMIAPGWLRAQFTYQTRGNALWVTGYTGPSGPVEIPSTANGVPVVGIGANAFSAKPIASVIIPSAITNIETVAFYACPSLASIVFSNGLVSIGLYAFGDCKVLESVAIPDTVVDLGDYCFANCTALQSVTFGAQVSQIGQFAFAYAAIASATLPATVTNIGKAAFQFAPNLRTVCFAGNAPTVDDPFLGNNLYVYYAATAAGWGPTLGGRPAIPWTVSNPASTAEVVGGQFGFTILGPALAPFAVDASTNLLEWSPILSTILQTSEYRFTDPEWSSSNRRFYRVRMP